MARNTGADCRQCRREKCKLFLKGERCYSDKCALTRRAKIPGVHADSRKKTTEYGLQLREKQKTKRIYGLQEKQFHSYYEEAERMKGVTGANMLILLEKRLDNVVYRMGIGSSRSQARQFVNHGLITVNGKRVTIPSYQIKVGDVVSIKENKQEQPLFVELKQSKKAANLPKWLDFDPATLTGTVLAAPTREDIDMSIQEHMIVELYSK
ncbi:MAG TPA: 30S ribosomal protein S4 [Candidatus Fimimonas merdipullorum]|uniref:Small ribosomal subunit protein uS4 n=1 Tax=Candidatus Fimimonas merdipullorum TaxID=2840822 RepID=A0A9D1MXM7_9BACT|nr:30S ribosomal protein S4 [Candidatus Fimimonas merdipullorum]